MRYSVRGRNFEDKRHDDYPHYPVKEEKLFEVQADSVIDAYKKMLVEHPKYAIGCGISCLDNNDFLFDATMDYYVAIYGTRDESVIIQEIMKSVEA